IQFHFLSMHAHLHTHTHTQKHTPFPDMLIHTQQNIFTYILYILSLALSLPLCLCISLTNTHTHTHPHTHTHTETYSLTFPDMLIHTEKYIYLHTVHSLSRSLSLHTRSEEHTSELQ